MKLDFGFLADYASPGHNNKLTIIGVFELVHDMLGQVPIPLPPCYLVARFSASVVEGSSHHLRMRVMDADGNEILPPGEVELTFQPQGPGRQMLANFAAALFGARVPARGDYHISLFVDGSHVGDVPFYVVAPPGQGG